MEKLQNLINAIITQNTIQHDIEKYAKEKKVEEIADKVREESIILNQLTVKERKLIRDEFYSLNETFKNSLTADQKKIYEKIEALGVIFQLNNERPK